jgi:hypothetical protein
MYFQAHIKNREVRNPLLKVLFFGLFAVSVAVVLLAAVVLALIAFSMLTVLLAGLLLLVAAIVVGVAPVALMRGRFHGGSGNKA